ncbi:MAG: amidase [Alphaproteobacteria bacterium]|nr:amidase [Alphaproteobacteria bacterium]
MPEPFELTACEALSLLSRRQLSAVELIGSCLQRIAACEPVIGAWTWLDAERALQTARQLDEAGPSGQLHGIPLGVKDVIDTADMPTGYGSAIYDGWRPAADAGCVSIARRQGAVILGKTVTIAFACGAPVRTANPLNPKHTSGGSSSGSAAAVAAKMVPVAFGSQSASSLIRPASYTGLVGMRPSLGLLSVAGFKYFNGSFDTIGLLGRSVDDVELLWCSQLDVPFQAGEMPARRASVAVCRPPWLTAAHRDGQAAIDVAERRLRQAGHEVRDLVLPADYGGIVQVHERMQAFEAARSYAFEYQHHRDKLDAVVRSIIELGHAVPFEEYLEYVRLGQKLRHEFPALLGGADCLLTAAASGEAPLGWQALGSAFSNMGTPEQSRPWTLLHLPVVTVPCHKGPNGLPVGVQLIARYGEDRDLLKVSRQLSEVLAERTTTQQGAI